MSKHPLSTNQLSQVCFVSSNIRQYRASFQDLLHEAIIFSSYTIQLLSYCSRGFHSQRQVFSIWLKDSHLLQNLKQLVYLFQYWIAPLELLCSHEAHFSFFKRSLSQFLSFSQLNKHRVGYRSYLFHPYRCPLSIDLVFRSALLQCEQLSSSSFLS